MNLNRAQLNLLIVTLTVFVVSGVFGYSVKPVYVKAQAVPVNDAEAVKALEKSTQTAKDIAGFKSNPLNVISLEKRLEFAADSAAIQVSFLSNFGWEDVDKIVTGEDIATSIDDITDVKEKTSCRKNIESVGEGADIQDLAGITANKPGFWAGVIGGGKGEAASAAKQAAEYQRILYCLTTYLNFINDTKTVPVYNIDESFRMANHQQRYVSAINALGPKIKQLEAQAKSGWKDVAKAAMLTAILKVNQNVTTNLINRAMQKYKINDYLAYADAVATQIYSMKYLKNKYPKDVAIQLAIRAAIINPGTQRTKAQIINYANAKAQEYANKLCDASKGAYEYGKPAYFKCLGANAAMQSSPDYYVQQIMEEAGQAIAAGKDSADKEMKDGNGYAPVRDCNGAVSEQIQNDEEAATANMDKLVSQKTLDLLKQSESKTREDIANATISPAQKEELTKKLNADLDKAQKDVDGADKRIADLQKNKVGKAIIDVCEVISSPAHFVSNSIDAFLKQHLDQATQLKSENLPFFANYFSNVVSNFLTNIIVGGVDSLGKKKQVVKEGGVKAMLDPNATTADEVKNITQTATDSVKQSTQVSGPSGNVDIYAYPQGGSTANKTLSLTEQQNYVLVIDFSDLKTQGLTGIKIEGLDLISGASADSPIVPLSAQQIASGQIVSSLTPTASFTLTVTLYGTPANGQTEPRNLGAYTQTFQLTKLPRATQVYTVPAAGSANPAEPPPVEIGGRGEVMGTSIILPRGPAPSPGG